MSVTKRKPLTRLWKGPCVNDPNGGVTQSLLANFLNCRERFRIQYIEGLGLPDSFNHYIEYGNMWHVCEEFYLMDSKIKWETALKTYCMELCKKYKGQQEQVVHWYKVCELQFPHYIKWWKKHPDMTKRTPLIQETKFVVPYELPNEEIVFLRGKWDSVDLVKGKNGNGMWLQENKTKSEVDSEQLKKQLTFDMQTMFYLVALVEYIKHDYAYWAQLGNYGSIKGVRYNVIRRPLSGGKGSIRQKQGETSEEFYERLSTIIEEGVEEDNPNEHYYFKRWNVEVSAEDIYNFKTYFLDPILMQLCEWYEAVESCPPGVPLSKWTILHYRHPYGIRNMINEGYASDVDEYLNTGSRVGLVRSDKLFTELQ